MMALAVMPFMALPPCAAHVQSPNAAYLLPFRCGRYILWPQRPLSNVHIFLLRKSATYPGIRYNFFIAHRYEEMSYREIAAVYELSEGQVTYELRAAKEALKAALKDYLPLIGLLLNGF